MTGEGRAWRRSLSIIALLAISCGGKARASDLSGPAASGVRASSANTFLSSLGVNMHVDQGYDPKSYVAPLRFTGIREVRDGDRHIDSDIAIARATGVHFVINAGGDLKGMLAAGESLAKAGALLALEGPNEPNNFPIHYEGQQGGGLGHSWYAVAGFQSALYAAAKADPLLAGFPIFGPSETGAETDDVGLQFCTIPAAGPAESEAGGEAIFPAGTRFCDYVNIHNYVSAVHGGYADNQAWNAASPTLNDRWDGLYGNVGLTWFRHFQGYRLGQLPGVPRVTTETGWGTETATDGGAMQAAVLTNTYLAQFKRGWRYTFIYELRDGEGGSGAQGLYHGDVPKRSAVVIHNLTTILADGKSLAHPQALDYSIDSQPVTVHDLLLQKSNGQFDLVIWDEKTRGGDHVTVSFHTVQGRILVYDITKGIDPVRDLESVKTVDLSLTDHAVIIAIQN